jgi:hypothetical protein
VQLFESIGKRALDGDRQIRHSDVQERVIIEIGPIDTEGKTRHPEGS